MNRPIGVSAYIGRTVTLATHPDLWIAPSKEAANFSDSMEFPIGQMNISCFGIDPRMRLITTSCSGETIRVDPCAIQVSSLASISLVLSSWDAKSLFNISGMLDSNFF